jgi:hypothetical protein
MASLKNTIALVTVLLFIYNIFFTYIVVNLTAGPSRDVFLILLSLDYVIIFYFILQVAHELKFTKPGSDDRTKARRPRR